MELFCRACASDQHYFCTNRQPTDEADYETCCCWTPDAEVDEVDEVAEVHTSYSSEPVQTESGRGKNGEDMKDPLSTGRKRAAKAKPAPVEGTICEWAGLKFAGGGVKPIIGCRGNTLSPERGKYARHHGPDKSVLNNSEQNLHLICPTCHNRWHTLNNPAYGKRPDHGEPFVPEEGFTLHDPVTLATEEEQWENELMWATIPVLRSKDDD